MLPNFIGICIHSPASSADQAFCLWQASLIRYPCGGYKIMVMASSSGGGACRGCHLDPASDYGALMHPLPCFKAYDVRGRVPQELDPDLAYRIGRAYAAFLSPSRVAVGRDVRLSSPPLADALAAGLQDSGAGALDLGHG